MLGIELSVVNCLCWQMPAVTNVGETNIQSGNMQMVSSGEKRGSAAW
jgi:hypothetical protein